MFSRQLTALGYPDRYADFTEDDAFRKLIVWIDKNHIHSLPSNDLTVLEKAGSNECAPLFEKYFDNINCPPDARDDRNFLLFWIVSQAVRKAYINQAADLQSITAEKWKMENSSEKPFVKFNYDDPVFIAFAQKLASILNMPTYEDHKEVIDAACMLVIDRLNIDAVSKNSSASAKRSKTSTPQEMSIPLGATPLGFESNDPVLNDLAKVLRLQHINELRELQTLVDEAIVSVQKITANPKTDTKLGKHGF